MSTAVIILAAGQGSRMKSDLPKVLHNIAGVPMLWHAMQRANQIEADRTIVIVGHGGDKTAKLRLRIIQMRRLSGKKNKTERAMPFSKPPISLKVLRAK